MGRTKVPQRELPGLLAELQEKGAVNVRRGRADFRGRVPVTWDDPDEAPMTDEESWEDLPAYVPVYVVGFLLATLVVGVVIMVELLGG